MVGEKPNATSTFKYFLEAEVPSFYDRGNIEVWFGENADSSMGEGRATEDLGVGVIGYAKGVNFIMGEPVLGQAENFGSKIFGEFKFKFLNFVADGADVEKSNLRFVVGVTGRVADTTCYGGWERGVVI